MHRLGEARSAFAARRPFLNKCLGYSAAASILHRDRILMTQLGDFLIGVFPLKTHVYKAA
jgi:hypothetical protein